MKDGAIAEITIFAPMQNKLKIQTAPNLGLTTGA